MITIYSLKPAFQNCLRPVTQWLARNRFTANQVTVSAIALSFFSGALIIYKIHEPVYLLILPAVLFIRMALNAIDGMLAREHEQKTRLGAILNELGDIFSDSLLYLPFALIPGVHAVAVVTIVVLGIITETTGILGVMIGGSRHYDGPMGKSDRALLFSVIALSLGSGISPGWWLDGVWAVSLALLVMTMVNRAKGALSESREG